MAQRPPDDPNAYSGQADQLAETWAAIGQAGDVGGEAKAGLYGLTSEDMSLTVLSPPPKPKAGELPDLDEPSIPSATVGELAGAIDTLDRTQLLELQTDLEKAGFYRGDPYTPGAADEATQKAWVRLLLRSARQLESGNEVTWRDVLTAARDADEGALYREDGAGGSRGARHTSDTDVAFNLTDSLTAQGIIAPAMTRVLGRRPTADEVDQFVADLNQAEQANPQTQSTQTDVGEGTGATPEDRLSTTTTAVRAGGLDPAQFAENWTQSKYGAEAGAYAIGTTYWDVVMQSLGVLGR